MSSLKDLASLIMIPSLYKDGRLDTVKPLGNSIIHPDATGNNNGTDGSTPAEGNFTFSRGSNLAATRVDVNGLIEKGRENLLLQSNQFDTTWYNNNSTETSGQSGYDGTNNAWLLTRSGGSNGGIRQNNTTSGVQTFSIYAKAGTKSWIKINNLGSSAYHQANFDLSNGVLGTITNAIDANIENVGNGWYRCSVTYNATLVNVDVRIADSDNDTSGTTGDVYIQDAQLEAGLVATDYIETGASTAQAGILEDMPRLDYSGGASCPALLLEPQRSNLLNHGEYFGAWTLNAGGTGSAPVLEANTTDTLSPEGKYNAYKVTFDSGAGTTTSDESIMYRSKSGLTAGSNHTASVYLKGETGGEEVIVRDTEGSYKKWTLTTEWARYEYTQIASASSYATSFGIRQGVVGIINSDAVVYIYGFQSELGSYPTSYIPTYGSSVTRSNEYFTTSADLQTTGILGSTWTFLYDNTYVDVPRDTTSTIFQITDGTGNYVRITLNIDGILRLQDSEGTIANSTNNKIVGRYDGTKIEFFGDGESKGSRVEGSGYDYSNLNAYSVSTLNSKTIKLNQLVFFPTALTDSECIALTTL